MLNVARALKPWRETGALNEHIPLWGFVDDHTFLTKAGDLGRVLQVTGLDHECLVPEELAAYTKRFEAALKLLDPGFRFYQYLFRRNHPHLPHRYYDEPIVDAAIRDRMAHFERKAAQLYTLEIYYVVLYHGFRYQGGLGKALSLFSRSREAAVEELKALFSSNRQVVLIEREIDLGRARLEERLQNFRRQLADFLPTHELDKRQAFLFFRRLVNPDPRKAAAPGLKYDTHLDFFVGDSALAAYTDHLRLDDYVTRIVTLKEPTAQSWPLILQKLYELPANYHLVTEWHALDQHQARKIINAARRHHHTQRTSLVAHMQDNPHPTEMLVDDSKTALVQSLGESLKDMELRGTYFGEYSLSAVLYDRDAAVVDRACGDLYKAFAAYDGAVYHERYNLLNSFFATLPGGVAFNLRRLLVTNHNAADYAFLFTLSSGETINSHLSAEYLAVLETQHSTPYFLNLHVQDIAHTLVFGKTGSGKSFLLNFLATNAQKYGGHTFFFDLGGSFKGITKLFAGTYLKIGVDHAEDAMVTRVRINPFSLPPTPENLEFLFSFLRVLVEGPDYTLPTAEEKELYLTLGTLYELDAENRTLRNLAHLLPRHIAERLHKWIHGDPPGQYAFLFDNADDTLELTRFLCVDFEGLDKYPQLVEPLLFYLLHRANAVIHDPKLVTSFKLFFIDEAWRFLRHPVISRYVLEALKTWRKRNAAMVLSTQSVDDLLKSDLLNVLLESCSTKIFLANPSLNEQLYRDVFKLNETAVAFVRGLRPKRQLLVVRPEATKVLNLEVDARSYWIYTNDPNDNARRDEAIGRLGFELGLDYLAAQGAQA